MVLTKNQDYGGVLRLWFHLTGSLSVPPIYENMSDFLEWVFRFGGRRTLTKPNIIVHSLIMLIHLGKIIHYMTMFYRLVFFPHKICKWLNSKCYKAWKFLIKSTKIQIKSNHQGFGLNHWGRMKADQIVDCYPKFEFLRSFGCETRVGVKIWGQNIVLTSCSAVFWNTMESIGSHYSLILKLIHLGTPI